MDKRQMLLERSRQAERLRETSEDKQVGLRESSAIWQEVLFEARELGDWERVVDVLGQLALNLKHLKMPALALIAIDNCLSIINEHLPGNDRLCQVYLAEKANLLGDLGKAEMAQEFGEEALAIARREAPADVCHVLVQVGKAQLGAGRVEEAEKYLSEAYQLARDGDADVAHPAHRAGAMIAYALLQRKLGKRQRFEEALNEAEKFSRAHHLARRLEQIDALR